jgi:hypothetical protein
VELIQELVDHLYGKLVFGRPVVQRLLLDEETPGAITFLTKSTGAEKGDVLGCMMPGFNTVAHCRSSSSFWNWGVAVGVHGDGRCARKEVDLVVIGVQWGQPVRGWSSSGSFRSVVIALSIDEDLAS